MKLVLTSVFAAMLPATAALADVSLGLSLGLSGDTEIKTTTYQCDGYDVPLVVQYLNAAPNFLALVPINGATLVFANVISASGAKYESGSYTWWTKGSSATLHDVTEGLDAAPVLNCTEQVNTP